MNDTRTRFDAVVRRVLVDELEVVVWDAHTQLHNGMLPQ